MISIQRDDGLERATSQSLRNERIDARSLERKRTEKKMTTSLKIEFERASLRRRDERSCWKNQQRKE